ncbi:hypothetical protein [Kutzneria sp. NPDC052558]|uniref:hypothetical protein n=1 Tax=Kutzneria sp. NPDC052558 TaxID=3364121 RepID=UPI0037C85FFD
MNTRDLISDLKYIGLPATEIVVGGIGDERYCVQQTADGQWEVFYYERGQKNQHVVVPTEHTACMYLFGVLAHEQVMFKRLVLPE